LAGKEGEGKEKKGKEKKKRKEIRTRPQSRRSSWRLAMLPTVCDAEAKGKYDQTRRTVSTLLPYCNFLLPAAGKGGRKEKGKSQGPEAAFRSIAYSGNETHRVFFPALGRRKRGEGRMRKR